MNRYVAAVDLGATSGRICIGWIEEGQLKLEEIYRFAHEAINHEGRLIWQWEHILYQFSRS